MRWGDLLEEAKPLYQLFLSIKQAFPSTDEGFEEAKEVIDEMVKTFAEKGIDLEESKSFPHLRSSSQHSPIQTSP